MTQESLAQAAFTTGANLSYIERGHRSGSLELMKQLDKVLGTGGHLAQLWCWPVHTPRTALQIGHPDMDRRHLLQGLAFLTGTAAINTALPDDAGARPLAEAPARVMTRDDVTAARAQLEALRAFDEQFGGQRGGPALEGLFREVADTLRHSRPDSPTVRCDMLGVAAEIAFLRGWKAHDGPNNQGFAQLEFRRAQTLAEESGMPGHDAWLLRAQAMQACDIGKRDNARALADEAVRRVKGMGGHVEALMLTAAARTAAEDGDTAAALAYLRQADPMLTTDFDASTPTFVQALCPNMANLMIQTGQTLVALDASRDAVTYFEMGRNQWNPDTHARVYAMDSYLLGKTYLDIGEGSAAESEWRRVVEVGSGVDSTRCASQRDDIAAVMPHLVPQLAEA